MRRSASLVTFVIVAVAALGSVSRPAAAASSRRVPLRGTHWVLTDRVSLGTPLDDVTVDAVFGAKRVEGTSGCNGYSSSYTTHGARMTIKNDGASTLMACDGPAGEVEPKYLAALARVGRWRISASALTLSTRTGRRLLVYRRAESVPESK